MITKAVILAAGYGSRFLPITRTVPKEMLPIGTRPALDLVVEELVEAGMRPTLRRSRGADIDAACGQLAARPEGRGGS